MHQNSSMFRHPRTSPFGHHFYFPREPTSLEGSVTRVCEERGENPAGTPGASTTQSQKVTIASDRGTLDIPRQLVPGTKFIKIPAHISFGSHGMTWGPSGPCLNVPEIT